MTGQRSARQFNKRTVGVRLDPRVYVAVQGLAQSRRITVCAAVRLLVDRGIKHIVEDFRGE